MNRRAFLQLAGLVAAASALDTLPAAASGRASATSAEVARGVGSGSSPVVTRLSVTEPGLYQVSGRVRLQDSLVQIGGITNSQTISWAAKPPHQRADGELHVVRADRRSGPAAGH